MSKRIAPFVVKGWDGVERTIDVVIPKGATTDRIHELIREALVEATSRPKLKLIRGGKGDE